MTPSCHHHWLLGVLAGLSEGQAQCKLCGATKPMPDLYIDVPYRELQQRSFGRGKEERPAVVWTARMNREA